LQVKYEKEVCLGLGRAATKCRTTGLVEGKRCKAFCYSGKVVLSIKDYDDKQNAELKRVKSLKGNNLWVVDGRKENSSLTTRSPSFLGLAPKLRKGYKPKEFLPSTHLPPFPVIASMR
jgi:hypothetical protein